MSLATVVMGLGRLWLARQYQRERKLRTAPGWGLLAEGPEALLEGPCPPTLKSSRCTMRRPVRCSGDSSAGRRRHRYFEPVSRSSPSHLATRCSPARTRSTAPCAPLDSSQG